MDRSCWKHLKLALLELYCALRMQASMSMAIRRTAAMWAPSHWSAERSSIAAGRSTALAPTVQVRTLAHYVAERNRVADRLQWQSARVTNVTPVGMGDR